MRKYITNDTKLNQGIGFAGAVACMIIVFLVILGMGIYAITHPNSLTPGVDFEYCTTPLSVLENNAGETIQVAGYVSMASPYDGSMFYLTNKPISAFTNSGTDGYTTDVVICYPNSSNLLKFTESCILVEGDIVYESITTSEEVVSPWYLSNCTYTVIEPTEKIINYHKMVNNGGLSVVDEWLSGMYNGLSTPDSASSVDAMTYEAKLLEAYGVSLPEEILNLSNSISTFNATYNEWVEKGHPAEGDDYTNLAKEYEVMIGSMTSWVESLKVTGGERNEVM